MPIYEFDCRACGEPFDELVFNLSTSKAVTCPHCGSPKVKKKLSTFSARVAGGGKSQSAAGASCAPGGL